MMYAVEDLMKLGFNRRQVDAIALELGYSKADEYPAEVREALLTKKNGKRPKTAPEQAMNDAANQHAASMDVDLADVDEGAQRRAASMLVGRDALTLYYLASRQFTIPGLGDAVDNSRNHLKAALRGEFYNPEAFLSQMVLHGMSGTERSLNGTNETSTRLDEFNDAEPLPTADSADSEH